MINKALKIVRRFNNLKQTELAVKLGISKSYLSEIESGKKPASLDLLEKYSQEFDIPVSSLVFLSESINNKGTIPEKFRKSLTENLLKIMEWMSKPDDESKIKA